MVQAFEGNKAETKSMLPVLQAFTTAHRLPDVTVVADAGMFSKANQAAIEAAGLADMAWDDRTIYYHYKHDRARRTLRGIDQQVDKAEKAVAVRHR